MFILSSVIDEWHALKIIKNVMILPQLSCAELFQNLTINPSKSVNEDKGSERKMIKKKKTITPIIVTRKAHF